MSKVNLILPTVVAIDGPSGCGKGTAGLYVAKDLGYHYLDSGKWYRAVALKSQLLKISPEDAPSLEVIAKEIHVELRDDLVLIDGVDYAQIISTEEIGALASVVGGHAVVRDAIHTHELGMRKHPGLVVDGRDAGRVFDTPYRFFIKTDVRMRALWRCKQLQTKGVRTDYQTVLKQLRTRDNADITRKINPLLQHKDSIVIDNTLFKHKDDLGKEILKHLMLLGVK